MSNLTPAPAERPPLTGAELRDAEQIRDALNDLGNRLGKCARNNLCFYAVNRAWRNMDDACKDIKGALA
jgi:hypothetical protein